MVGLIELGWGTEDAARALDDLKRFGSVTVLNGHIHQIMQKVEGSVTLTAMSTAFPNAVPAMALVGTDEGRRRQAAFASRRNRCHFQAWTATPRDHRPASAALRREVRIMTAPGSHFAIAAALGVAVFTVAIAVPVASAQVLDKEVHIDAFAFALQRPGFSVKKTGTTVTWINDDDIPRYGRLERQALQVEGARYQR